MVDHGYGLVREGVAGVVDRLSFGDLAFALTSVVAEMEKPVVVGIFAKWGSGKVGVLPVCIHDHRKGYKTRA